MACTFADDAYLIAAFPFVVARTPERWVVVVVSAAAGAYNVTLGGASFPYAAANADTPTTIRDGLQFALGGQPLAAIATMGVDGLAIMELQPSGLGVTASGPGEGSITATLQPGTGDSNAAARAFWLERAKCGLPPCCVVTCAEDFTLMHAALAAHMVLSMGNTGGTGQFAGNFTRMDLGPASLINGAGMWKSPADSVLATTEPGRMYLMLRARYVFPFACA
jgi:hypothetical protein